MPLELKVVSGGQITTISGGVLSFAPGPGTSGASMSLLASGGIVINTTIPPNNEQNYQDFITSKRDVMTTGGIVEYNGVSQSFVSGGYVGYITSRYLMSLQGVQGYADSDSHSCNININPSLGVWLEPGITVSGGAITTLRAQKPCVSCEDYNNIFATEMVLYHSLNKLAWQNMYYRTETSGGYPEGLWLRYQALVTAWNRYTYKSEYLTYNNSLRESLNINVGWSNPSCDSGKFLAITQVNRTSVDPGFDRFMIFYPGNMLTTTSAHDNNTYTSGSPISFIVSYNSNGAKIFCGAAQKSDLTSALSSIVPAGSGGSAYQEFLTTISSATVVNDVQEFNTVENQGQWLLGIAAEHIGGMGYAAQNFGLGLASDLRGVGAITITAAVLDTYTLNTYWWTNINGEFEGPVLAADNGQTLKTYSITVQ